MYEHQLSGFYVFLGEVQDVPREGALQGQVAVTGWCDNELQPLRFSVQILRIKIFYRDFCLRTHKDLRKGKEEKRK